MMGLNLKLPKIKTGPFNFAPSLRAPKEPPSFADFIRTVNPRYAFHPHVKVLLDELDGVLNGTTRRLMIFMPPRHFKSETVSRLFSAYYLLRHPRRWVGLASYGAELAYALSRNARTNYLAGGGELYQAKAVRQWETYAGGGMWAAGVGGAATGKGFHLGIVDDPLKNAEEAASETIRLKQQDWYRSVFTTRQAPDAALIVIQTRWHEMDLAGWLLAQEEIEPEGWRIVSMEAIKSAEPPPIPATCALVHDPRLPGEALCPALYPVEKLQRTRAQLGSYFWSALYDQRPLPPGGGMFKREWFDIVGAAPANAQSVRAWDKAGTEGAGDYSAGVKLLRDKAGLFYVADVVRGQWSALARETIMRQTATLDGTLTSIVLEQEPGSGGLESAQNSIRNLAGFRVHAEKVTGEKATRAMPFAAQCEAGNVKIVKGDWNTALIDELCSFPYGAHDDQVDAAAAAFNRLALPRGASMAWE